MHIIQMNHPIEQVITLYKYVGMWPSVNHSSCIKIGQQLFHLLVSISFCCGIGLGAYQSNNINESVFLSVIALSDTVVITKQIYILRKNQQINGFIRDFLTHSVTDHTEYEQIRNKLKKLINFIVFYLWMVFAALIFIIISPAFSTERSLPFNIAFPWDWRNNKIIYLIAYIYLVIATATQVIASTFVVIIWYLMANCSIKYDVKGNEFKNICYTKQVTDDEWKMSPMSFGGAEEKSSMVHKLIVLIKGHRNIQESIERFRECISNLFFIQIVTSSICICGSVFILAFSSHNNLATFGLYVVMLFYFIFDIFMATYFGNEIKLSSDRLSYCLFQSNWIDQMKSFKTCMTILTEALKHPHEMVIFKVYPLNLATFTRVLNLSYSVFNILKNFK